MNKEINKIVLFSIGMLFGIIGFYILFDSFGTKPSIAFSLIILCHILMEPLCKK